MRLSRQFTKLVENAKTAFQVWVAYSILWVPFWALAWIIKLTGDPISIKIYDWIVYAGYPAIGLAYCFISIPVMLFYALLWVFALTMPWGIYAAPFLALAIFIYVKIIGGTRYVQTEAEQLETLRRSAPSNILNRPLPKR